MHTIRPRCYQVSDTSATPLRSSNRSVNNAYPLMTVPDPGLDPSSASIHSRNIPWFFARFLLPIPIFAIPASSKTFRSPCHLGMSTVCILAASPPLGLGFQTARVLSALQTVGLLFHLHRLHLISQPRCTRKSSRNVIRSPSPDTSAIFHPSASSRLSNNIDAPCKFPTPAPDPDLG